MVRKPAIACSLIFLIITLPVAAEQAKTFGDYTVHYNAFTTDALSPDMARLYKITRSNNRALLNVAILKQTQGKSTKPVKARVTASATNLTSQLNQLEVREIIEGGDPGAIYYLAETAVHNGDTLNYTVSFTPEGETRTYNFTYQQQFVTE